MPTIRIQLPIHLRVLAQITTQEIQLDIPSSVTQRTILDALESKYPNLTGTLRDHDTLKRRPMIRFYACNQDLSHESPDAPLPASIASGKDIFYIIAAIAGG